MKNHFEIHKKEPFFVENEEKYKEMLDNINKMKNMVLDFDNSKFVYKGIKETITNVVNNINSTASRAETNLSCSMSSNEEPKESFYNNSNDSQEKIKNNKNKILNEKNEKKEKDKDYDGTNIIKNDINSNKGQININEFDNNNNNLNPLLFGLDSHFDIKIPIYPDNDLDDESNHDINAKVGNNNFLYDDISIEGKDFPFQNLSQMSEKEKCVRCYLNNISYEEKAENEFENYDCYSKITNLNFQPYKHMMDINL